MAEKTRTTLKAYFETGDRPTQEDFADLVDSFVSRRDDSFVHTVNGQAGHVILPPVTIEDSGWLPLTLINGFSDFDPANGVARYRKKTGVVYVEGCINFSDSNTVIGQLPAGFRPGNPLLFTVSTSTGANGHIWVMPGGDIVAMAISTVFTSLAGIIFLAD